MTRRHPRLLAVLTALGFFLGQFGALVHATQHELLPQPHQAVCAICSIAHAAGVRPAIPSVPPVARVPSHRLACDAPRVDRFQSVNLPPSRAPPLILV